MTFCHWQPNHAQKSWPTLSIVWPLLKEDVLPLRYVVVLGAVQAGRGVHGLQEAAPGPATEDHRLLRASVPRQNVRREANSRGGQRVPQRGLTLNVLGCP